MNTPSFPVRVNGQTIAASHVNDLGAAVVALWPRACEVDFGAAPTGPTRFTVTDAAVTASSAIVVWQDGATPTGGFGGEAAWDPMVASAKAGAGQFTLDVTPLADHEVGKFRFVYLVG